jgi:hypothetical protein
MSFPFGCLPGDNSVEDLPDVLESTPAAAVLDKPVSANDPGDDRLALSSNALVESAEKLSLGDPSWYCVQETCVLKIYFFRWCSVLLR